MKRIASAAREVEAVRSLLLVEVEVPVPSARPIHANACLGAAGQTNHLPAITTMPVLFAGTTTDDGAKILVIDASDRQLQQRLAMRSSEPLLEFMPLTGAKE
jgi:hypothetical protein